METFRLLVLVPLALVLGAAGLALLLLPASAILRRDRQTGYWLASRAKTPERGRLLAGAFYKLLALVLLGIVVVELLPSIFQ